MSRLGNVGLMDARGVLAVGASAGGVEALIEVAAGLPAELPACVLVTLHVGGRARSRLPHILARSGPLPAAHPRHGEVLHPGRIYVAPPGCHLLAVHGAAQLSTGPMVNRHRPAIDVMFASAARWADGHTVAAVLSGMLDDGAVGAALVARSGGQVLVQDPAQAMFDSMPRAAWAAVPRATAVPAGDLGRFAAQALANMETLEVAASPARVTGGGQVAARRAIDGRFDGPIGNGIEHSGDPLFLADYESRLTRMACPECGGGLAQVDLPGITYYRCHIGHQFAPQSLEAAQREGAEAKLWSAVSGLEEHAALARHLAHHPEPGSESGVRYLRSAQKSADLAQAVRSGIESNFNRDPHDSA